ncbi:hypothetical protein [Noviherbaspirillum massiliense]|uniref:hypothetical protein n=1 Tax=Noviherbaspirillum massiliense TaxID=1465823 RepID=UPI00037DCA5B|nr:hypothetical protein [Noviherbaspirillum massiliense]
MRRLAAIFLLTYSAFCAAADCRPEGDYQRPGKHDDELTVTKDNDEFELGLSTSGQLMADGVRTIGAIKGPLSMSSDGCVGALISPDDDCTLFVEFGVSSATVHQFGSCNFGNGAWGGGKYRRLKQPRS